MAASFLAGERDARLPNAPSTERAHMVVLILRAQPSVGAGMRIGRSYVGAALACLWSSTATAITPATPQQMVCVPVAFIVATITAESPSVSIPEHCKEGHRSFCAFDWPITIKIDQVVAARSANSSLRSGSVLHVNIGVRASEQSKGVAPEDWQGHLSSPFSSAHELTGSLRNRQFIFGLLNSGDRAQIWSVSFQATLKATLMEAATNGLESQRKCPRLTN